MNVNQRLDKYEERLAALERHRGAPLADNQPAPDDADAAEQVSDPPGPSSKPAAKSTGRGADSK